ncbi:hypothetical protein FIE12Z_6018 [Fusarium flagelliforme]|uniref:Piwi domain-containing protein n=2 Tax=Fusarium flagelliforme TaxID=2675880 RepID=A0A395MP33_9HYPO|nr:hypothetical protein FIE12Z_6018 [Fusarium flagelliforme]
MVRLLRIRAIAKAMPAGVMNSHLLTMCILRYTNNAGKALFIAESCGVNRGLPADFHSHSNQANTSGYSLCTADSKYMFTTSLWKTPTLVPGARPTMIVGCDVSHAVPGDVTASLASTTVSVDSNATRCAARKIPSDARPTTIEEV